MTPLEWASFRYQNGASFQKETICQSKKIASGASFEKKILELAYLHFP